jgi:hypothetical protein
MGQIKEDTAMTTIIHHPADPDAPVAIVGGEPNPIDGHVGYFTPLIRIITWEEFPRFFPDTPLTDELKAELLCGNYPIKVCHPSCNHADEEAYAAALAAATKEEAIGILAFSYDGQTWGYLNGDRLLAMWCNLDMLFEEYDAGEQARATYALKLAEAAGVDPEWIAAIRHRLDSV